MPEAETATKDGDDVGLRTIEVAKILRVSDATVRRLADEGILKHWRTPGKSNKGHRRFDKVSVEEYRKVLHRDEANKDKPIAV